MTINLTLYRLLVKFGATAEEAESAATSVDVRTIATRQDLAELEARLAWKIGALVVTAMVGLTGIFAAIVKLT